MEKYLIAIIFVLLNLTFWLGIIATERFLAGRGKIPRRRPLTPDSISQKSFFLSLDDWTVGFWGDLIGLSATGASFGLLFVENKIAAGSIAIGLAGGFLAGSFFHAFCTRATHKPDAEYPGHGATSLAGYLHLIYFFLQSSIILAVLVTIFTTSISLVASSLFFLGLVTYLIAVIFDIKSPRQYILS